MREAHIFLKGGEKREGKDNGPECAEHPRVCAGLRQSTSYSQSYTMCVLDLEDLVPSQSLVEDGTQGLGHTGQTLCH